jgi:hypothetical protein
MDEIEDLDEEIEYTKNNIYLDDIEIESKINHLLKILEKPPKILESEKPYIPPKTHGLENSIPIIPIYYQKKNKSFLSVNFFEIIKDDIRNMRKLNEYQLKYIEDLNHSDKIEVINLLNNSLDCATSIIYKS